MPDLAQQIRDRLDEWLRPSGEAPPVFTEPADVDPEQAAVIQAAWDAIMANTPRRHEIAILPPSPFDLMRRAILAILDLHAAPERALPGEIHCGELIDWMQGGCPTLRVIAEKLGIEVEND